MKSKVIFYCVLVFCSELVASVPYTADLQRYSGSFPNIPSLERSIQGNVPRPYKSVNQISHDDGLYNPPNLQYQALPRFNRDPYFSQNPRESFSSLPVRGISSGRYSKQQRIPSGFPENYADTAALKEWENINLQIQNRPIQSFPEAQHQNNRFINVRPSLSTVNRYNNGESSLIGSLLNENRKLGQLVNKAASIPREPIHLSNVPALHSTPEPFFPQIPAIPVENSYRNSEQSIPPIDEHFLQNKQSAFLKEEYSAPVISQNKPAYNIPLQPVERLQARAGNPVENIPEPIKPAITRRHYFQQLYKAHPNLQNVLSAAPNTKRYLVVHSNGTVESVDSIESVAQRNPNYVLVQAGDLDQHFPQKPIPKVILKPTSASVSVPTEIAVDTNSSVVQKPIVNNTQQSFSPSIPEPVTPLQISTKQPQAAAPKVIISHTVEQETINSSKENISSTVIVPTSTNTTDKSVGTSEKNVVVPNTDSLRITKTDNLKNSTIGNSKTATPVTINTVQPRTSTISSVPRTIESNTVPSNIIQQTKLKNNVPVSEYQTLIPTNSTLAPEPDDHVNYTTNENTPATPTPRIVTATPIYIEKENTFDAQDNNGAVSPIPDNPVTNSTTDQKDKEKNIPTVPTVDSLGKSLFENKNITTFDAQVENANVSPTPNNPVNTSTPNQKDTDKNIPTAPNLGTLDFSQLKAKNKPAVWFRTSDPNFWDKLTEGNETYDVIYFFQIHNQPKIERDITKIIHPNGTIVEELTETVWDNDTEEPTVKKTSKIIHPEEE